MADPSMEGSNNLGVTTKDTSNATAEFAYDICPEPIMLGEDEEAELRKLLVPDIRDLPPHPPTAVESNFVSYFAPGSNNLGVTTKDTSNATAEFAYDICPEPIMLGEDEEAELRKLLVPDIRDLPPHPPTAVESNFVSYFAPDFTKPGHDQYVYRHANGLCVIGLAPTHVAFKDEGGITAVDFNVGKSDRSGIKVSGKRKKNAQHFESNTALCKVCTKDTSYIIRCCVKGSLLEVNDRLMKQPDLLNTSADREGYIAILMPRPADWLKAKASLISIYEYKKLKGAL